ncbi:MAG: hypothetical protein DRP16_04915, partial [Candidatus Aenigmatarchaeota archaeon]
MGTNLLRDTSLSVSRVLNAVYLDKPKRGSVRGQTDRMVIVLIVFLFLFISIVELVLYTRAADMSTAICPSTAYIPNSNQIINITVSNTDSNLNITKVNITIPAAFTFIEGSNQTTASQSTFSNTSIYLVWSNVTDEGIVENGSTAYFLFNVSLPDSEGIYNITITSTDTDSNINTSIEQIQLVQNSTCDYYCSNCSNCSDVIAAAGPGERVCLSEDITNHDGTCVEIHQSNITFDCRGHMIDGDGDSSGYGIYVNAYSYGNITNITIR